MPNDTADLLQIKIEQAKAKLPAETLNAIAAIDWKTIILELRSKRGYTFEQLGDLELETELLLCGLISTQDYPKELEKSMGISEMATNALVNEMNELVFKKIREELIKNVERKRIFQEKEPENVMDNDSTTLKKAGIKIIQADPAEENANKNKTGRVENRTEILAKIEHPPKTGTEANSLLAQKLSGPMQTPTVKTDHTLENISKKDAVPPADTKPKIPAADPYREIPE